MERLDEVKEHILRRINVALHKFSDKESKGFDSDFIKTPEGYEHHYKVGGQHVNVVYTRKYKGKKHFDVDFKVNHRFTRPIFPSFSPVTGAKILLSVRQSVHNFKKRVEPKSYHFEAFDENPFFQMYKKFVYQRAADKVGEKYKGSRVRHLPKKSVIHFNKESLDEQAIKKPREHKGYADEYSHEDHNIKIMYDRIGDSLSSYKVHFQVNKKWKKLTTSPDSGRRILWGVLDHISQFVKKNKPAILHLSGNSEEKDRIYRHAAERLKREYPGSDVTHIPEHGSLIQFKHEKE